MYTMKWIIAIMMVAVFMAGCMDTCQTKDGMEQITPVQEAPPAAQPLPEGAVDLGGFMKEPVYDEDVSLIGQINHYGELLCPCFMLKDMSGTNIQVWYDLMLEEDGSEWPSVSMKDHKNGDWVVVTGQLRSSTGTQPSNDFYLKSIQEVPIVDRGDIEQSEKIARDYVLNSPTYKHDGHNLKLVKSVPAQCPDCFGYTYEFISSSAGYGDRSGMMTAQVMTPHTVLIDIAQGEVTRAWMDPETTEESITAWDMKNQEMVEISKYSN